MAEDKQADAVRFGRKLQRHRLASGMTQAELGDKCPSLRGEYAATRVGFYEQGRDMPRLSTAVELARALGVALDTLVG